MENSKMKNFLSQVKAFFGKVGQGIKRYFVRLWNGKDGEKREKFTPLTIIMLVVLCVYVFTMIFLIGWTLVTSVKHEWDFAENVLGLPTKEWGWHFENYQIVAQNFFLTVTQMRGGVPTPVDITFAWMFIYAFIYSVGCAFFKALVPMLTAYMCAKFNYWYSKVIHTIVIVTMILPIIGSLPAEIRMAKFFGLYDQLWGLWIMRGNFLGMYFLIFYGGFKALPMAYSEAAKIDGAGNMDVLVKIILPLVKNTFFTIFILHFIAFWNDYNTPLVYMPSYPTVAFGLFQVTSGTTNAISAVPMRMAAAMMMLIPILVLFLSFHKRLLGNLTVGGLKG